MKLEINRLREAYQSRADSIVPEDRNRCPAPMELAESFEASTSVRKKKKTIDHISECALCRREFMVLWEQYEHLSDSQGELSPAVSQTGWLAQPLNQKRAIRFSLWRYSTVLLGIALVITSILAFKDQLSRRRIDRSVQTGIQLVFPQTDAKVSSVSIFRWKVASNSELFRVEIFDKSLLLIWESPRIRKPEFRLPDNVFKSLHPGEPYFWSVTAYWGDTIAAESKLSRFFVDR